MLSEYTGKKAEVEKKWHGAQSVMGSPLAIYIYSSPRKLKYMLEQKKKMKSEVFSCIQIGVWRPFVRLRSWLGNAIPLESWLGSQRSKNRCNSRLFFC